ncbi:Ger(x)C family spore germination protein [Gottfriedia solisilvae]|uniref:Spore germination protein n=1 Tax=Gottfriedia solisilvae TaxID=1516104 RepID=A0A8J3ASB2_9BACI|nr:Ger(x)C family spore germination protein [Gottfriedia solisilvae]GGI17919.1 hypothetical protein GCM10007380_40340 [Gottfriedia solisilvae]
MRIVKLRRITALFLLFLLVGCNRGTQIEDLAITLSTGIDEDQDKLTITSEIVNTASAGGDEKGGAPPMYFLETVTEKDISTVLTKQKLLHPRELFSLHNKVIVFGEESLKKGVTQTISEFARTRSMRGGTLIVGTRGKAQDLLKSTSIENQSISDSINQLISRNGIQTKVINILDEASGKHQDTIITILDTIKMEDKDRIIISGAAVLNKGKLVGYLNEQEMNLISVLRNQKRELSIKVKYKDKPINLVLQNSNYSLNTRIKDNKPKFIYKGILSFNLENAPFGELSKSDELKDLQALVGKELNRELNELFKKILVQYKSDPMGLGNHLFRFEPTYWKKNHKQWERSLKDVDYSFNNKINIRGIGFHS